MSRRSKAEPNEHGFTLVEMLTCIVLMGLVMLTLCVAVTQSLTVIPRSGARSQLAADADALLKVFTEDIAQAQTIQVGGVVAFNFPSTQNNTGPILTACTNTCATFGCGWLLIGGFKDQSLGSTAPQQTTLLRIVISGTAAQRTVEIYDLRKGIDSRYLSGFCRPTDTQVVSIQTFAPSGGQLNERVRVVLNLRDKTGDLQAPIYLDAAVRAQS